MKGAKALDKNAKEFGVHYYPVNDVRQGIVHIVGPEQGWTLPGMTVVCGDSHTSTHGALGALAHGIGTSEVEHVLATQCLVQKRPKTMRINYGGELRHGVTPKDLILATIGRLGTGGMTGVLSTADTTVTILTDTATSPAVAAGGSTTANGPFLVEFDPELVAPDHSLSLSSGAVNG